METNTCVVCNKRGSGLVHCVTGYQHSYCNVYYPLDTFVMKWQTQKSMLDIDLQKVNQKKQRIKKKIQLRYNFFIKKKKRN